MRQQSQVVYTHNEAHIVSLAHIEIQDFLSDNQDITTLNVPFGQ